MKPCIFRGRQFTESEIALIKQVISSNKNFSRRRISRTICEILNWRQENGRLKDMACRDALLRMHRKGIIKLPKPRINWSKKNIRYSDICNFIIEENPLTGDINDFNKIKFELVNMTESEKLWNYIIDRYHYLGYKTPVGHYLKYLVYLDEKLAGCIAFADAVLKLNIRDNWIGWSIEQRERNLRFVINNNRFLILPWIKVKNLASKVLSIAVKQVQEHWQNYYKYKPVLVETFVDIGKFIGTCYKSANWIYLGETKGKGRRGMKYFLHNQPKAVYVYPLCNNFKDILVNKK